MMPFLSDRRVLATSAAVITVAILAFLVGTYPTWRKAIGIDRPDVASLMPPKVATPEADHAVQATATDATPSALANTTSPAASAANPPQTIPEIPNASSVQSTGTSPSARTPDDEKVASSGTASGPADQPGALTEHGPTFDIVRVEPSGDSVIAGRATPGADIVLLDQGQPIARAKADGNGQVAFIPPALAPGEHSLMLSVGEPGSSGAVSAQSVSVSVPAGGKSAPMVALIAPGQPTKLLSGPPTGAASGSTPGGVTGSAPTVAVSSIDVEDQGGIYATGKAAPDSHCRVYLNGAFVAAVTAGRDGVWSLKIKHGMRPGRYSVRVDQLQSAAGQVQARAEVPFDYPDRGTDGAQLLRPKVAGKSPSGSGSQSPTAVTGGAATTQGVAPAAALPVPSDGFAPPQAGVRTASADTSTAAGASDANPTIVSQLLTTKVIRGDSLWRISRKMLGHGLRYTQIYAANTAQIRDPKLIYPGQIFVMPQTTQ